MVLLIAIRLVASAQCSPRDAFYSEPLFSDTTVFLFDSSNNSFVVSKKILSPLYRYDIPSTSKVNGDVIAYFDSPENQIAAKAFYSNGILCGNLILYYPSGRIKEFINEINNTGYSYCDNGKIEDTSFIDVNGMVLLNYYESGALMWRIDSQESTFWNTSGFLSAKIFMRNNVAIDSSNYKWFKNGNTSLSAVIYGYIDSIFYLAFRKNGQQKFEARKLTWGIKDCTFIYYDEMEIRFFNSQGKVTRHKWIPTEAFMKKFRKKSKRDME